MIIKKYFTISVLMKLMQDKIESYFKTFDRAKLIKNNLIPINL